MIRFRNYRKSYTNNLILALPSLELEKGLYWLKGGNGIGKTTLLKSIAGIIPFEGEISVDEVSIKQKPIQYRQLVNYAAAEPVYPGFLTGNDLISFYQKSRRARQEQVNKLISAFGISKYSSEKTGTYSSGMAKKLALVLAFTGKAKVILLDEPFTTLDQQAIQALNILIEEYSKAGTTFLISSHQPFAQLNPTTLVVADKTIQLQPTAC